MFTVIKYSSVKLKLQRLGFFLSFFFSILLFYILNVFVITSVTLIVCLNCFLKISLSFSGDSDSSREITSICGERNPYEVIGSGQYVYLKFYSNDKNFYPHSGVTVTFNVFSMYI